VAAYTYYKVVNVVSVEITIRP